MQGDVLQVEATHLLAAFRDNSMKITPQRRLLCALIAEADDHPTVEAVHQRAVRHMPNISLKTVYTTLTELADVGAIRLSALSTGSLRVDHNPSPHAHFVCTGCGRVFDQPLASDVEKTPSQAEKIGFNVQEQIVIYRGRCADCDAS